MYPFLSKKHAVDAEVPERAKQRLNVRIFFFMPLGTPLEAVCNTREEKFDKVIGKLASEQVSSYVVDMWNHAHNSLHNRGLNKCLN